MILSLATLEECQDARAILVEKHNAAQAEWGKYVTHKNLALKGQSEFKYWKELADAENYLNAIIEALGYVRTRIHDIKFGGMPETAFIMRAIQQVFGDEGKLAVLREMTKIREETRAKAIARPGLALEPIGSTGNMRVRYL